QPQPSVSALLERLRRAVRGGKHWYIALLETMAEWTALEEDVDGRRYVYVVAGEAFDWLALAERLCLALGGLAPEHERDALVFRGRPPLALKQEEFRRLLGPAKHKAHLNFLYGVEVEEALHLAVEEDLRKERRSRWRNEDSGLDDEVFHRIYGCTRDEMLRAFQRAKKLPRRSSLSLTEWREFLYWRFKWRLKFQPRPRIASDTKKGLDWLHRLRRDVVTDERPLPGRR
ncbi:MAG: hypothetical protein AAB502_07935, partial [Chloroflexota bacterium]